MYAIIEMGGRQYRVQPGEAVYVEKLEAAVDSELQIVPLLVSDGTTTKIGAPTVAGASVTAKVGSVVKGEKLRIFKMKRRKGYRRNTGHRQTYTTLHVLTIQA